MIVERSSVDRARPHHQLFPNQLFVEHNYPTSLIENLQSKGHRVKVLDDSDSLGVVQLIIQTDKLFTAGADFRTNSRAEGF